MTSQAEFYFSYCILKRFINSDRSSAWASPKGQTLFKGKDGWEAGWRLGWQRVRLLIKMWEDECIKGYWWFASRVKNTQGWLLYILQFSKLMERMKKIYQMRKYEKCIGVSKPDFLHVVSKRKWKGKKCLQFLTVLKQNQNRTETLGFSKSFQSQKLNQDKLTWLELLRKNITG